MSGHGVPNDEVTAADFMLVRAALVRRLGGANEALVWTRIHFRCSDHSPTSHRDLEGRTWWPASYDLVAEETGLSAKQVRTAIDKLVKGGFLIAEKMHLRSAYDHTLSYSTVVYSRVIGDVPAGAGGVEKGRSDLPSGADLPSIKKVRSNGDSPSSDNSLAQFEIAWKAWPRGEGKQAAMKAWAKSIDAHRQAASKGEVTGVLAAPGSSEIVSAILLQQTVVRFANAYRFAGTEKRFVPHLSSWLNQERWSDPLPTKEDGREQAVPVGSYAQGDEWMEFSR